MAVTHLLGRCAAFALATGAAVVTATSASAAAAVGSDVTSNWAGYVSSAALDPTTGLAGSFSTVSGNWVQPAAKCASTVNSTSSAFWVGLGGDSDSANALEQIGTESDCTASGAALYSAWYELVPAASVKIGMKIAAGDKLSASVGVKGTKVSVKLSNLTTGKSFSRVLHMAAPDTTSAEWIAEAPSLCASSDSSNCRQASLTNFGKVSFSHASVTTPDGSTGTISDPAWSATAVELDGSIARGGFGRFTAESGSEQALPGGLTGGGSAFTVRWRSVAATSPGSGYGSDPYGGDPYGYRGGY
ncbi:MAG TPA: G1 family glutamic endopeptidase [Gaiellaceae bacterium]|jgi:hypothetical protein